MIDGDRLDQELIANRCVSLCGPSHDYDGVVNAASKALRDRQWSVLNVDASQLVGRGRREALTDLEPLLFMDGPRVLAVSGTQSVLASEDRGLFDDIVGAVGCSRRFDSSGATRLLVALSPRDARLLGPTPNFRERHRCIPIDWEPSPADSPARFQTIHDILVGEPSDRRIAAARSEGVRFMSMLPPEVHRRLQRILQQQGSSWRPDLDPELVPLVWRDDDDMARVTPPFESTIANCLLGEWPSRNPVASGQRFRSRLANEAVAYWIDPYLGVIDTSAFAAMLSAAFAALPAEGELRLIARRNPSRDEHLDATALGRRVAAELGRHSWFNRLKWRLFDGRTGRAHDRHLLLSTRLEGFSLPPADRVVGSTAISNECDSQLAGVASLLDDVQDIWERSSRHEVLPVR